MCGLLVFYLFLPVLHLYDQLGYDGPCGLLVIFEVQMVKKILKKRADEKQLRIKMMSSNCELNPMGSDESIRGSSDEDF